MATQSQSRTSAQSQKIVDAMKRGLETCNASLLTDCYSDSAEIRVVDKDHPPSNPMLLRGKDAISGFFRDICGRDMKHKVESQVVGDHAIGITESCQYSSGMRVLSTSTAELEGDKIVRETLVQAWDA